MKKMHVVSTSATGSQCLIMSLVCNLQKIWLILSEMTIEREYANIHPVCSSWGGLHQKVTSGRRKLKLWKQEISNWIEQFYILCGDILWWKLKKCKFFPWNNQIVVLKMMLVMMRMMVMKMRRRRRRRRRLLTKVCQAAKRPTSCTTAITCKSPVTDV